MDIRVAGSISLGTEARSRAFWPAFQRTVGRRRNLEANLSFQHVTFAHAMARIKKGIQTIHAP
jgi:hypothetical protein